MQRRDEQTTSATAMGSRQVAPRFGPADSGTIAAAPALDPPCPACEHAAGRAWSDPAADYCAGVAAALAATELKDVRFPFHFCAGHRALVREATQRAEDRPTAPPPETTRR